MSLDRLGSMLHPVGEEREFWKALRGLCEAEGTASWDFEAWDSILEVARLKSVAATDDRGNFAGQFGYALLVRYRWLRDARARGLTPVQAEREFCGRIDRERAAFQRTQDEIAAKRAQEAKKTQGRKRGSEAEY